MTYCGFKRGFLTRERKTVHIVTPIQYRATEPDDIGYLLFAESMPIRTPSLVSRFVNHRWREDRG